MGDGKIDQIYVDGIQIALTEHGAKLFIQVAEPNIASSPQGNQIAINLALAAVLNLSYEHLKLFVIYAHQQLRDWEKENSEIPLSKKVVEARKIDLKAEW